MAFQRGTTRCHPRASWLANGFELWLGQRGPPPATSGQGPAPPQSQLRDPPAQINGPKEGLTDPGSNLNHSDGEENIIDIPLIPLPNLCLADRTS